MERKVQIFGWATIVASFLMLLTSLSSILWNPISGQVAQVTSMFPQLQKQMNVLEDVLTYNRIWSIYSVAYFAFILSSAILFIRHRFIGCLFLEIACWVGILNAFIDTGITFYQTTQMKKALSGLLGTSLQLVGPLTTITLIIGFLLWVIPSILIILFLRKQELRQMMKER
jgi:glucan phosphoethanolaminetransferase (alkaline phosphatase superfamily)